MNLKHLFEPSVLDKFDRPGPRYTSYPTALEFHQDFYHDDFLNACRTSPNQDLSLYIHVPFCHSLCYYCACNKVVTRHQDKAERYLDHLIQEIHVRSQGFKDHRVIQIHLGGGTPTFLQDEQLHNLLKVLRHHFRFSDDVEISIEIDPRQFATQRIDALAEMGFNRISIGVQDTDDRVQQAINRTQSTEHIAGLVARAKQVGMAGVNLDLIYGLPFQTEQTFGRTLSDALAMDVARISLFSYAHLPQRFAAQRKIPEQHLPGPGQKLELMRLAMQTLTDAGYVMIGMDHFAKPDDELAIAQGQGRLQRNFQGYTTLYEADLLGLGVSSISHVNDCFSQNHKQLKDYYQQVNDSGHGLCKGLKLTQDDTIRGFVIRELMCNLHVNKAVVNQRFDINFDDYFSAELEALQPFVDDALVEKDGWHVVIQPRARLLVRRICMLFDAYLSDPLKAKRFSQVI
ncbi:oxygen-independent coproporphyrinogen III oxidase [Aestuariibacter halophilus]|uniref:Coproporphyrinogen-III oxidase n=1 Tax=Fluctibacter halophilus TaxID=226011 RepID=A0ABS8GBJ3_9ALTE|nr:oxygen-independent coproporphyrinogen III oxidase [Aestuariibacter halophilus]MCC2616591.1 oxygen-independent coproporphyrinogen III oxidase [Aestuariibacter halophilus]